MFDFPLEKSSKSRQLNAFKKSRETKIFNLKKITPKPQLSWAAIYKEISPRPNFMDRPQDTGSVGVLCLG